jgi:cobalt/nickel transport system permease protein
MNSSKTEKKIIILTIILSVFFAVTERVQAMHIMEGYLPLGFCISWGIVCVPFLVSGVMRIRHTIENSRRTLILFAMSGAFIFVISSLKIPSVTGSSSHMTGTGLAAILFGVSATSVLGIIVLVFQAVLLAHGGLTTLGANTFSMAIAGPMIAWILFQIGKKLKLNKLAVIFLAAAVGDLLTYCVTCIQLALAYPSEIGGFQTSLLKFFAVFAPTQVPLAIVEGVLTVLIMMGLQSFASRELADISFTEVRK